MLTAPLDSLCTFFLAVDDYETIGILFPDVALVRKVVLEEVVREGMEEGRGTDSLEHDDDESPDFAGRRGHWHGYRAGENGIGNELVNDGCESTSRDLSAVGTSKQSSSHS